MKLASVCQILPTFLLASVGLVLIAVATPPDAKNEKKGSAPSAPSKKPADWRSLFDGKSLDGWKVTNYGGEGEVNVEEGLLVLDFGGPMTGVTWKKDFPKTNYEVRCQAQRADGHDFFCGMTFPVNDSHCSLIVGGWGGAIVGLSSLNGHDASENETTEFMKFDNGKWYQFRVRVLPERIQAWIDDKQVIDVDIKGVKVSTRIETDLNKPFGFASYQTKALLRNIEVRELK